MFLRCAVQVARFFVPLRTFYLGHALGPTVDQWLASTTVTLRILKLFAMLKPSVLTLLQSRVFGQNAFNTPVPPSFPGWRCVL